VGAENRRQKEEMANLRFAFVRIVTVVALTAAFFTIRSQSISLLFAVKSSFSILSKNSRCF
jgi:hypothetical protein